MGYVGINTRDPKLSFGADTFNGFTSLAYLAIKAFGPDEWSFENERDGRKYDPRTDLYLPAELFEEWDRPAAGDSGPRPR